LQPLTLISFILYRQLKISNASCLDETTISMDMILYLSLYYLVYDLVCLPNPTANCLGHRLLLLLITMISLIIGPFQNLRRP